MGVVISWALIGSVLRLFIQGPPAAPQFAALAVSLVAAGCYLYYLSRAGFKMWNSFTGRQLSYVAVLIVCGVTLLSIVL